MGSQPDKVAQGLFRKVLKISKDAYSTAILKQPAVFPLLHVVLETHSPITRGNRHNFLCNHLAGS